MTDISKLEIKQLKVLAALLQQQSLTKAAAQLAKCEILILDDWGIQKITAPNGLTSWK